MIEEKNGKPVNMLKLTLLKPVIAHGDEVNELFFREPIGADIAEIGSPVMVDFSQDPPKISYEKSMTPMLARLAMVPPSTIKALTAKDWESAALLVTGFFLPDPSRISFSTVTG